MYPIMVWPYKTYARKIMSSHGASVAPLVNNQKLLAYTPSAIGLSRGWVHASFIPYVSRKIMKLHLKAYIVIIKIYRANSPNNKL